jgi:ABC-type Na+ transport system ATPase subunit NatA
VRYSVCSVPTVPARAQCYEYSQLWPAKGTATIGGYDIVKDDIEVRRLIGIVSEKMIMYDRLTAIENLLVLRQPL